MSIVLYLTKTFVVETLYNYNLLCYVHEMLNIATAVIEAHAMALYSFVIDETSQGPYVSL